MVVMRLASEQQLTHDCLSRVDVSRLDGVNSPNVEALMTLLWAIQCFEKERGHIAPKLDAATEVRQAIGELDELFRHGDLMGGSFVPHGRDGDPTGLKAKSLEGWRTAFR
jgi:transcriptional activator HAC1